VEVHRLAVRPVLAHERLVCTAEQIGMRLLPQELLQRRNGARVAWLASQAPHRLPAHAHATILKRDLDQKV